MDKIDAKSIGDKPIEEKKSPERLAKKTDKNFEQMVHKTKHFLPDHELSEQEMGEAEEAPSTSIFDLSSKTKKKHPKMLVKHATDDEPKQSQTSLFDASPQAAPLATHTLQTVASITPSNTPIPKTDLVEVIQQLTETITHVSEKGVSTTQITLKGIPLFEGAQFSLKEFDMAKKELNLSFENLSQVAKNLLDHPENRQLLKQHLADRGYVLHIMTTNTEFEKQAPGASQHFAQKDQDNQEFSQRQQQQQDQEEQDA